MRFCLRMGEVGFIYRMGEIDMMDQMGMGMGKVKVEMEKEKEMRIIRTSRRRRKSLRKLFKI